MKTARKLGFGFVALFVLMVACGEEESNMAPGPGATLPDCPALATGAGSVSNVIVPGDRYDFDPIAPATDPRTHPLFQTIWNTIRVQQSIQCWQAQGGTNNLQFFENPAFGPGPRYRFVGFDTEAGPMIVHSVGCYFAVNGEVLRAVEITTYSGDRELLGIASGSAIDHFIGFQGTFPLVTRYIATATLCL